MRKRIKRPVRIAGIVFILALAFISFRQSPAPAQGTQAQPQGRELLQKLCSSCHALERVTASPRSRAQWEETLNKMVTLGAKGTADEFATVLNYLAQQFGPQAPTGRGPGNQGPAPPPRNVGGGAGANDKHLVDAAAADRGKKIWAAECITCHGTNARGAERGSNLIRSELVLRDRYGSEIGALLRKGHPTQSGTSSANFTQAQVQELSHFIHQRVYDTLRGSPIFEVQNVLTGDAKAGAAFFNGEGKCSTCHSPTGDLAGIGRKYNAVTLQQRFLFPRATGGRGRGGAPPSKPVTVTVTPPNGAAVSGVLVHLDDFNVSLRDSAGEYHSWKRTPELKVVKNDPYAVHNELLDKYTDKNMHDIVAYLETLK